MAGPAAVGVDDDLAAGQSGVAHRPTEHELARRVDQQPVVGDVQTILVQLVEHHLDHLLADVRGQQIFEIDIRGVLRGEHDGVQPDGLVAVVLDGDLSLTVGTQVRQQPILAHLSQAAREPVCQRDGQRHQLGGVVDGVAEHQALIAGSLSVQRIRGALDAGLVGRVDTLRNVGRLRTDGDIHTTGVAIEALGRGVIADLQHPFPDDVRDIDIGGGGHLTGDMDLTGGHQRLHRHPGLRVLREHGVQDRVTDGVTDLVRMPFGH
ncbi:Uncharacterised protein [Mycobacteroides abscessus]|nr:Uncharacterised protein [Mycobacteroides abscessus]